MVLHPFPGYALVKLNRSKYHNVVAQVKVYEAPTEGKLLALPPFDEEDEQYLRIYKTALGKVVYWQELNAVSPITVGDDQFAYVKLQDLMGYEDA
jgi:hypothetical protein